MNNLLEGLPSFVKKTAIAKAMFPKADKPNVYLRHKETGHGRAKFTPNDLTALIKIVEAQRANIETFLSSLKSQQE